MKLKLSILLASFIPLCSCSNLTPEQNAELVKTGSYLLVKVVDRKLGPAPVEAAK